MLFLAVFTSSLMILPNGGQPMGYMEFCPLQMERLQSTRPCKMEICPVAVNPEVCVPCEVEQINNPELGQSQRAEWKMVKYKKFPWTPCVLRLKPHQYRGTENFGHAVVEDLHRYRHINIDSNGNNSALRNPIVESSSINGQTNQETTKISEGSQSATNLGNINVGRGYTMCVTHICTLPKRTMRPQDTCENMTKCKAYTTGNGWTSIFPRRPGQQPNSTTWGKTQSDISRNSTGSVAWLSPGLVTLNCLACLIGSDQMNRIPIIPFLSDKPSDSPLDNTILNITDGEGSNSSKTPNDDLVKEHKEDWDDDVNKQINDEQPTTENNTRGSLTEPRLISGLEEMLTSTERRNTGVTDETKVPRHMNNLNDPRVPQNSIETGESTINNCIDCNQQTMRGNSYEYLQRPLQYSGNNVLNNFTSQQFHFGEPVTPLPRSGIYSMCSSALMSPCHFPTILRLNQGYAGKMEPPANCVLTQPLCLSQCSHLYFPEFTRD